MGVIDDCAKLEADKALVELRLESIIKNIIFTTTTELLGDNEDPEETLERYI